jgi:hypothetical protein
LQDSEKDGNLAHSKSTTLIKFKANLPRETFIACSIKPLPVNVLTSNGKMEKLTFNFIRKTLTPIRWELSVTSKKIPVLISGSLQPYSLSILFDEQGYPLKFNDDLLPPSICCNWNGVTQVIRVEFGNTINKSKGLTCLEGNINFQASHNGKAAEVEPSNISSRPVSPSAHMFRYYQGNTPFYQMPQSSSYPCWENDCCTIL